MLGAISGPVARLDRYCECRVDTPNRRGPAVVKPWQVPDPPRIGQVCLAWKGWENLADEASERSVNPDSGMGSELPIRFHVSFRRD